MAQTRGRGRGGGRAKPIPAARSRKSTRTAAVHDDVPEAFRDMLVEHAASNPAQHAESSRPVKRRKTARHTPSVDAPSISSDVNNLMMNTPDAKKPLQTVTDDSEESEDEMEWEDALPPATSDNEGTEEQAATAEGVSITLDEGNLKKTPDRAKRKGVTKEDRALRLAIHKMHLLCLLIHVHIRNAWCNDAKVQALLGKLLNPRIRSSLNTNPSQNQYQRTRIFIDALTDISTLWRTKFLNTSRGLRRPRWAASAQELEKFAPPNDTDDVLEKSDFRRAAADLKASEDVGAQLFCALLRAAGVEARLVCSLQPLPFGAGTSQGTPVKALKNTKITIYAEDQAEGSSINRGASRGATGSPSKTGPSRIRRIGHPSSARNTIAERDNEPPAFKSPKKVLYSLHPVYWVEAFNPAHQKWIAVDPLCTKTIDKPAKLEPPLNNPDNVMSYVIAFEDDGVARDVTKRYVKAYNAKVRKLRVESTEGGERWWKKTMKIFKRLGVLDRDQVEDAELAKKEASEGMPRNVQDFKDHPLYVLERHLKHNEVVHPKHVIGKVNAGTAASAKLEPIYRRRDLHVVRSADKWFRLGREIKVGEQPLKHAMPKRGRRSGRAMSQDGDAEEDKTTPLYAAFQTSVYVPPPVVDGRIPKNTFGNLDVYVPSMVPPGAVHIHSPHASKAAKILGIDFADAVVGFNFKGRHGTAVVEGCIIAQEQADAIEAVLDGFRDMQEEAFERKRTAEALRLWKRFLIGLRIIERVGTYATEGEQSKIREELDEAEDEQDEGQEAGGFFPGEGDGGVMEPTAGRFDFAGIENWIPPENTHDDAEEFVVRPKPVRRRKRLIRESSSEDEGTELYHGDHDPIRDQDGGEFLREDTTDVQEKAQTAQELGNTADDAGGFLLDEETSNLTPQGGGFILEDADGDTLEPSISRLDHAQKVASPDTSNAGSFLPEMATQDAIPAGGGFMVENNEGTHADIPQSANVVENADEYTGGGTTAEENSTKSANAGEITPEGEPADAEQPKADAVPDTAEAAQASDTEESDHGSLLSHDPEDDDAEPQWLESD